MKDYLLVLAMILAPLLLICGCVKHSTNPVIDKGIHITESVYPSDNAIEEDIEEGVEAVTGLDVDLSPGSPEGPEEIDP